MYRAEGNMFTYFLKEMKRKSSSTNNDIAPVIPDEFSYCVMMPVLFRQDSLLCNSYQLRTGSWA